MSTIASTPGLMSVLVSSVIARLPVAMLGIGLLVHAEHLTGSFAAGGAVAAAYAIATGVGGPLLGRLVDRRGQTAVLLGSALAAGALLGAVALLPAGSSLASVVALAAAVGLTTPPLGACARTLVPSLVDDPETVRVAYTVDATAVEFTWVFGPPLALGVGAVASTGAALAAAGAVLLLGTFAFATLPASRRWRPSADEARPSGGSLRAPGMRTLVIALIAAGVLFGAAEVGVAAAAETLASTAAAGPLLAIWGAGSLVGGVLATRLGGGADSAGGLVLVLAALAAGHLALAAAAGSLAALALTLFAAGTAIAPAYASIYTIVERVAPAGTVTEAFAWMSTAIAIGTAAGAAGGGMLADGVGPAAAFVLAGGAGAVAVVVTALRVGTLAARPAVVALAAA
jgi:predicted MFS family arabinose efflux permease